MRPLAFWIVVLITAAGLSAAESKWRTVNGSVTSGEFRGLHGNFALIVSKSSFGLVPVPELADEELVRLADLLIARPTPPPVRWSESTSRVAKDLKGRLQILKDGQWAPFELGDRPEPEYYLAYFSAHWCGPCRRFTPGLVQTYTRLKREYPDRFELIFISSDQSGREQLKYAQEAAMPWPVLRFNAVGSARSIERWEGNGIPCLVLVDREGYPIFHSYDGDEYLGPGSVLDRFQALLAPTTDGVSPPHEKMHRLAVLVHTRSQPQDGPPKKHWIGLDESLFPTLRDTVCTIWLEIDADGRVVSARPDDTISEFTAGRLRAAAGTWQFLPAIRDGRPVPAKVKLPFRLGAASRG